MRKRAMAIAISMVVATAVLAQGVEPPVIEISARQYEATPSEITLHKNVTVTLRVTSEDRIQRFSSKDLGFNLVLTPNQPREVTITPGKTGRFVVSDGEKFVINVAR